MIDGNKLWSSVGSAGIVDPADTGKVVFVGSVAQMSGIVVLPPHAAAAVVLPQTKAVIRYPVTPVDGVAQQSSPIERYFIKVLARRGRGSVHVRFLKVPIPVASASEIVETALFDFATEGGSTEFSITNHSNVSALELDFVNNCYYAEVTLSKSANLLIDPPGIAVIQLRHTAQF